MDAHDALRTIETPARVALGGDDGHLSSEALADVQRRALKGILTVIAKTRTKPP